MIKSGLRIDSWLGWLIFLGAATAGHEWLGRMMIDERIVAQLLSPGPHLRLGHIAIAVGFILLRMVVIFCLPGIILSRLGLAVFDRRQFQYGGRGRHGNGSPLPESLDVRN